MVALNCEDCLSFQSALRDQLDAFKMLATLNERMGWQILTELLYTLLKNAEQKRNEARQMEVAVSKELAANSDPGQPDKEVVNVWNEESHKADENDDEEQVDEALSWRKRKRRRGWKGWEKKCRHILESLWSHADAFPFRHPVDSDECPDYGQFIDRPMCLEVVKERLERSVYKGPTDFDTDILLIFQNSRTYNTNERSEIRRMTHRLRTFYEYNVQRQEMLSDWMSSKLGKRPSFVVLENSNGGGMESEVKKLKKETQDPTKIVHQPGETEILNKSRVRGGAISCRKCFKIFHNYDVLGVHALKCKGRELDGVQVKRRQGQKAITAAKKKIHMKLKLNQKMSRQRKIQERQKLRKAIKSWNKKKESSRSTKKNLGKEQRKQFGKWKYQEAAGLVIRNAFPGFNLRRALGVKVQVEPLRLRWTYFQAENSETRGQRLEPNPTFHEDENLDDSMMTPDDTDVQPQESLPLSEFGTVAHNTSWSLSMETVSVEEEDSSKTMSDMVLDKLVGHHYHGSPMKVVHELNWADIESRTFVSMDEEDFMSSHQNNYASLLPVQTEFDHDFIPNASSSLMPLTPVTIPGINNNIGGGSHDFYQNSFL